MTTAEDAQISVSEDSGKVTITGGGTLTFFNAGEFGEKLNDASLIAENVIVDLRPAVFIDTQIVQDLGRAAVVLLNRSKRLKVTIHDGAYPLRVLRISGFEEIMDIEVEQVSGRSQH